MGAGNFVDYIKIHCKSGNGGSGRSTSLKEALMVEMADAVDMLS